MKYPTTTEATTILTAGDNLQALLSGNLRADSQTCGCLRSIPAAIAGTVFHPLEVSQMIEKCFRRVPDTAPAIAGPFEQVFFAMMHLPYLQPFEDMNKCVSRLAAKLPLIRENLSPLSFVDVPEQAYIDTSLGVRTEPHRVAVATCLLGPMNGRAR